MGRNDDIINSFWNLLTFRIELKKPQILICLAYLWRSVLNHVYWICIQPLIYPNIAFCFRMAKPLFFFISNTIWQLQQKFAMPLVSFKMLKSKKHAAIDHWKNRPYLLLFGLTLFLPGEGGISPLIVCHVTKSVRNRVK